MGKRVTMFLFVGLATLQVLQATGLEKMPFHAVLDDESNFSLNMLAPMSINWNMSTQWLGALRSSYSQILRYETNGTLSRMTHFSENVQSGANKYKDEIKYILDDVANPHYSNCTEDKNFASIQQEVEILESRLRACAVPLKTLRDKYEATLDTLAAQIDSRSEEIVYTHCLPTGYTITQINQATKCFYASLQEALSSFYYPMGTSILRTVTEYRSSIAQARDLAYACAVTSLSPAIATDLEVTRKCLDSPLGRVKRGFGKRFKKLFRKAKNGVKKICSKVPCQIGYSVPFG